MLMLVLLCHITSTVSFGVHGEFTMYTRWNRTINREVRDGVDVTYKRNEDHLRWAQRIKASSVGREQLVSDTLKAAAGVYKDKEKAKTLGLETTVLTTVISYPKNRAHFKHYFRNFLCFAHTYAYDLVVYVTRNKNTTYVQHLAHVEEIGKLGVRALPFPEELFWLFVYGKSKHIHVSRSHVKYAGDLPTFYDFGALVMIIPSYEVVGSGYDLIFMDVDLGLVIDPIPHMILGDADFVASVENRDCEEKLYAYDATTVAWDGVEFNTGMMLIRSSKITNDFMTTWLEHLVDHNLANDQLVLDRSFKRMANMTYASNCLPASTPGVISTVPSIRNTPESMTYCFLSDILFQNGKTSLTCTREKFMHGYTTNMIAGGIPGTEVRGPESAPFAAPASIGMYRNMTTGITDKIQDTYYMSTIHVNFAGGKSDELNKRGLWLYAHHDNHSDNDVYDRTAGFKPHRLHGHAELGNLHLPNYHPSDGSVSCRAYNISSIHYSHMLNFREKYASLQKELLEYFKELDVPGTVLKRQNAREVYLVGNNSVIRGFPNGDTFIQMGFEFGAVKDIPGSAFHMFHQGPELRDLSSGALSPTDKRRNEDILRKQHDVEGSHLFFVQFGVFTSPNINYGDTRYGRDPEKSKGYK